MNVDIDDLSRSVLDRFRNCESDYGHSDVSDSAKELVQLIRAVVQTEVQAAFLETVEASEAKTQGMAEAAADERRCPDLDRTGRRCRMPRHHETSLNENLRTHRFN